MNNTSISSLPSIKFAERLTLFLIFALPFVYNMGLGSYSSMKYFFLGTSALALFLASTWTWMRAPWLLTSLLKNKYFYGLSAYVGAYILASIFSEDIITSFFSSFHRGEGAFTIIFLYLVSLNLLTLFEVHGKPMMRKTLTWSVYGSVILSILIYFSTAGMGTLFQGAREGASVGNSSVAATYVLWNVFFSLTLMLTAVTEKDRNKWVLATFLLLISPLFLNWHPQFQTQGILGFLGAARGATLGLIYGGIIAGGCYLLLAGKKFWKFLGSGTLSIVLLFTIFAGWQLMDSNSKLHNSFTAVASETRFMFWGIAKKAFLEKPLLGWGPSAFNVPYQRLYDPQMITLGVNAETWVDRAHNLFWETLSSGGLVLLAGLCLLIVSIIFSLFKARKQKNLSNWEVSLVLGALAGWIIQAQFVFESILSWTALFLIASISYSLSQNNEYNGQLVPVNLKHKITTGILSVLLIAVFTVTIASPFLKARAMYSIYGTPLSERVEKWKHFSDGSPMGRGYDTVLIFRDFYSSYAGGIAKDKEDNKQLYLDELDALGTYVYDQAITKNINPELSLLGALLLLVRMKTTGQFTGSDLDRTIALSNKIMEYSPTNPSGYLLAAEINIYLKKKDLAKEYLEKALAFTPNYSGTHQLILKSARMMNDIEYYANSLVRAKQTIPDFKESL